MTEEVGLVAEINRAYAEIERLRTALKRVRATVVAKGALKSDIDDIARCALEPKP